MARPGTTDGNDKRYCFTMRPWQWEELGTLAEEAGLFETDLPNRAEWLRQIIEGEWEMREAKRGQGTGSAGDDSGGDQEVGGSGDGSGDRSRTDAAKGQVRVGRCPKCEGEVEIAAHAPPEGGEDADLWRESMRRVAAPATLPLGTHVYCSVCTWQGNVWYAQEGGAP